MTIDQFDLLARIQTITLGFVAFVCFVRFSARSLLVRLVGFVFLAGCMANLAPLLLIRSGKYRAFSNVPAVFYAVITIGLFSYIYWVILFKKRTIFFVGTTAIFATIAVINLIFVQKTAVNSNLYVLYAGIIICYTLWYFYILIRDLPTLYLHQMPMFWFNSAFLLLNAGTFFLFSFTSYLVNVLRNDLIIYWSFHNVLSIFCYLIVLIGLYYDFLQLKRAPNSSIHREV